MKTTIILASIVLSFSAFAGGYDAGQASSSTASGIISAIQHKSTQEYLRLIPSLQQFHYIMDLNAETYGNKLVAAKQEFELEYESQIIPAAQKAFERVIQEGKERGIKWSSAKFARFVHEEGVLTVVISSQGKEYSLLIKTVEINGKLGVTQFIRLI